MSVLVKKILRRTRKNFNRWINNILEIKSPAELEYMKKAAAISDAAYLEFIKIVRPEMSELELLAQMKNILKNLGSEKDPFDLIVGSGRNGAAPHAVPQDRKIQAGEPLVLDFGATCRGYCSDITRTVCLGEPPEKLRKIYDLVLAAQSAALAVIRPGITAGEIDSVAREIITQAGYPEAFSHSLGHGIGLDVHEKPAIKTGNSEKIKAGMCFTVEPGIYLAGWGGVRLEDMVYVTANGCELLTRAPKELKI